MLMQEVELADTIRLTPLSEAHADNICRCSISELSGKDNLACKAADLMRKQFRLPPVCIEIEKRIPIAAGMGGGSSDAAAVIEGMNRLYNLSLSLEEKEKLGALLGSDIPFFFTGGTAIACGRGEVIKPCPDIREMPVLLVKPDFGISTPESYRMFDPQTAEDGPDLSKPMPSLEDMDAERMSSLMMNHLEKAAILSHPIIEEIKASMLRCGARGAMMTGSGPTVFAIYQDFDTAKEAEDAIRQMYPAYQCVLTKTKKRVEKGA